MKSGRWYEVKHYVEAASLEEAEPCLQDFQDALREAHRISPITPYEGSWGGFPAYQATYVVSEEALLEVEREIFEREQRYAAENNGEKAPWSNTSAWMARDVFKLVDRS